MGNLFQENLSRAELARSIAYLPQGKNVPDISADRMVLHGRFPYLNYPRRYRESDFQIAREAMRQMGIEELAGMQMSRLSGEGKTIVLVLHDILLALKISHRIAAVAEGRISWSGTPEEMLEENVAERLYGVAVGAVRTDGGEQYYYKL